MGDVLDNRKVLPGNNSWWWNKKTVSFLDRLPITLQIYDEAGLLADNIGSSSGGYLDGE